MIETPGELPFGARTAQRLIAVAERFSNTEHVRYLPASWGTLYQLSRLDEAEFEKRLAAGEINAELERSAVQWWLGDWWAFGEHQYGDRKALVEAEDWRGPTFEACKNAASVCRAFERSRRRDLLSFSHHAEVAKLVERDEAGNVTSTEVADSWLDRAAREDLSVMKLRAAIKQGVAFQRTRDVEFDAKKLGKFVVLYAEGVRRRTLRPP
jgi:hypothetical protein